MVPGRNGPREKWSRGTMVPGKLVRGKMVPGKMVPRKLIPGKLRNEKSWGGRRASWCVCVWNVRMWSIYENPKLDNKHKTRKQTQNLETKNRGVSVEHRGVCVCVECSDVINLWKPKTRQQIFLDSFYNVLQFGTYLGSWRKRQTFFCVCSGINWLKWKSRFNFLAFFWRRTIF